PAEVGEMPAMLLAMPEPGEVIGGKFRIVEKLHDDASGAIYSATEGDKGVVLKELDTKRLRENDGAPRELFEREAAIWKELFHPGVPASVDAFETDGRFYLVQVADTGRTLASLVADEWKAEEVELTRIAREALAALAYLHTRKPAVIHGDITPDNVVREEE